MGLQLALRQPLQVFRASPGPCTGCCAMLGTQPSAPQVRQDLQDIRAELQQGRQDIEQLLADMQSNSEKVGAGMASIPWVRFVLLLSQSRGVVWPGPTHELDAVAAGPQQHGAAPAAGRRPGEALSV